MCIPFSSEHEQPYLNTEQSNCQGHKHHKSLKNAIRRCIIQARVMFARDIREAHALHIYSSRNDGTHPMLNRQTIFLPGTVSQHFL